MRRGGRHPAWPCIGAGRQLWLGRRFGHLMALGSQRRHGRDPVDPSFLDLAGPGAREPRFRDLGLPGDRRLTFTPTRKEHAYDSIEVPLVATARRALTNAVGEFAAEFKAPLPDRLVRHRDAA